MAGKINRRGKGPRDPTSAKAGSVRTASQAAKAQLATDGAVEPHAEIGLRGYDEFEIDIETILRVQLPAFFEGVPAAPLTSQNVHALPARAKGAYMLFLDGRPVYAGKTDTRHGFRDRLDRHAWTIQGRIGLEAERLSFKAVRIMVFSAFDVEAILIAEMKRADPRNLAWNNSGFGSNDPGKNRDGQEPADFDKLFPIDINFVVDGLPVGNIPLKDILAFAKGKLPFLIRTASIPSEISIESRTATATLRHILEMAVAALPAGWQATVLHGRVILYRETRTYQYKLEVMRS